MKLRAHLQHDEKSLLAKFHRAVPYISYLSELEKGVVYQNVPSVTTVSSRQNFLFLDIIRTEAPQ